MINTRMAFSKNPDASGQTFMPVFCVLYISTMHFKHGESAAPNSPNKIVPELCPTYRYLSEDENGNSKCRRCSQCPKGFQVETKCNVYNDTVCEQCSSGWYNDVSGSRCKPCSGCKPGEYIRRQCSTKKDTSCRPCPRNMFSVSSNSSMCLPCKACKKNEERLSKCSSTHDTVCGHCEKGYFRVSSTGSCLQCSYCPPKYKNRVVPECRERLGLDYPSICWPGSTIFRSSDLYDQSILSEEVTNGVIIQTDEESAEDTITFTLIVLVFVTFSLGVIIMVLTCICLRQIWRITYSPISTSVSEPPSIPLSQIVSTNESLHNSINSEVSRNNSIEYTNFPSTDNTFEEHLEVKSPRSISEPEAVYSSAAPVCFLSDFADTDARGGEALDNYTDEIQLHNYNKYRTI